MRRTLLSLILLLIASCTTTKAQDAVALLRSELQELGCSEFEGNEITLLPSAQAKYEHLFRSISEAQRFIHLEYFKIMNDSAGNEMMHLLAEKAQQGVEVRILLDGFTNQRSKWPWSKEQRDSLNRLGVQFYVFSPPKFPWLNYLVHRDHRKLVVIDGCKGYIGGMNVGDYYLSGTARTGTWRDMHLCIVGPAVDELQRIFATMWNEVTGEQLDSTTYLRPKDAPCGETTLSIANRLPKHFGKRMRKAHVAALDGAQEEIRIVSPYFTNVRSVRRAMYRALKRGVRLRLMVSSKMDIRVTPEIMGIEMRKMMRRGAEVYYFENGFHHSKITTIDGTHATVGTANYDGRSMLFDHEVNAFVYDPSVVAQLDSIFDKDLEHSELLTPTTYKKRFSLGQRILGRVLSPLRSAF